MSAYSVAKDRSGGWTWWTNWEMGAAYLGGYENIRPATAEEAALMDKVLWDTATAKDRKKLLDLIKPRGET